MACPACHTAAPTAASGGTAEGFDEWIDNRNFRQPDYAVRYCEECGLYYKSDILPQGQLSEYYRRLDSYAFEYDGAYPTDRLLLERLAALADRSRVLDYGCSTGRILKSHAGRLQCVGVEPNTAAAAAARARGIAIVDDDALSRLTNAFDAVLITDVYEHLTDPINLLERLARCLAPGGWLAIVTGNADGVRERAQLASFWYFRSAGHLIMASERHVQWLASRLDLALSELHRCSHYDQPLAQRLKEHLRAFAFDEFKNRPRGVAARVMRVMPRLRRAESWPAAPAFRCGDDHVVAFLTRRG